MGNLIKPIIVSDGAYMARHPVFDPIEITPVCEDYIPTSIEFHYCELQINQRTGKSRNCEHKQYARWEHLPRG